MVDKRQLQHRLKQLRQVKTWQLLIILFFGIVLAVTLLRLNSLGMVQRRDAVIAADASGNTADTEKALVDLQHYVSAHMNTSFSKGVFLQKVYERDRNAALGAASATESGDTVAQQASIECRAKFQGGVESYRNDYVTCVLQKVSAQSSSQDPVASLKLPKQDNYIFRFASPAWTPDLAGFAVLFCAVIVLVILTRLVTLIVLRILIRHRFQTI